MRVSRLLKFLLIQSVLLAFCMQKSGFARSTKPANTEMKGRAYHLIKQAGRTLCTVDHGHIIRNVKIIPLTVYAQDLPFFHLLNHVHITTRIRVIERELRFKVGDQYQAEAILETERNLRRIPVIATARIFTLSSKKVDTATQQRCGQDVDVWVITEDLWSLRLEIAFEQSGKTLNALQLKLVERNVLGLRQSLALNTTLSPFVMTSGLSFSDGRFGPDLAASVATSLTWNRQKGVNEGQGVAMSLSRPLYHLDQPWSFGSEGSWQNRVVRLTQGDQVRVDDDPSTAMVEAVPLQWNLTQVQLGVGATRQWSGAWQRRLTFGLSLTQRRQTLAETLTPSHAVRIRTEFMPPDRFQLGPTIRLHIFERKFTAKMNLDSYGIREDFRLGWGGQSIHGITVVGDQAYTASQQLSWSSLIGKALISLGIFGGGRLNFGTTFDQGLRDLLVDYSAMVSRRFSIGRLLMVGRSQFRWRDTINTPVSLGSTTGLRGFIADAFLVPGGDLLRTNIEYRSPPASSALARVGLVTFYDGGSVHRNINELNWRHSVGTGIRVLFPQLNRSVFRLDIGVPIQGEEFTIFISSGSQQAISALP